MTASPLIGQASERRAEKSRGRSQTAPMPSAGQGRAVFEALLLQVEVGRLVPELDRADVEEAGEDELAREPSEPFLGRQVAELERGDEAGVAGAFAGSEGAHPVGTAELELLGAVEVVERVLAL